MVRKLDINHIIALIIYVFVLVYAKNDRFIVTCVLFSRPTNQHKGLMRYIMTALSLHCLSIHHTYNTEETCTFNTITDIQTTTIYSKTSIQSEK